MLDPEATPRTSATQAQPKQIEETSDVQDNAEVLDMAGNTGGPGRIRTYNQQIMSLLL